MTREAEPLVVQTSKFPKLAATQLRPLSKEERYALVARGSLHHQVVMVERGKFGGKLSHRI